MPPKKVEKQRSSSEGEGQAEGKKTNNKTNPGTSSEPTATQSVPTRPTGALEASDGETTHAQQTPKPAMKKRPLQPIEVLLGDNLVNAEGETISPRRFVVENGVVGLYFAAKWCPPCRMLLPQIMLLYEEVRKEDRQRFEVIYISYDSTAQSFNEYLDKMPWWAIGYQDEERREELAQRFNVRGIPVFLLLDVNTLEIITREGRLFTMMDPRGAKFPWKNLKPPTPSSEPATAAASIEDALKTLALVAAMAAASTSNDDDDDDDCDGGNEGNTNVEQNNAEDQ